MSQTIIRTTHVLKAAIRAQAVRYHMPITRLIELALTKLDDDPAPQRVKPKAIPKGPGKGLGAQRAAIALADAITVERTDTGLEYVSLAMGDWSLVLTPEKRREGFDVVLMTGRSMEVLGSLT